MQQQQNPPDTAKYAHEYSNNSIEAAMASAWETGKSVLDASRL